MSDMYPVKPDIAARAHVPSLAEYERLYQKDEAVRQKVEEIYRNEGLTDQEYERMFELEDICFGYTSGDA